MTDYPHGYDPEPNEAGREILAALWRVLGALLLVLLCTGSALLLGRWL